MIEILLYVLVAIFGWFIPHIYRFIKLKITEKMNFKYFRERYSELEIKEFSDKFSTGTFHMSKWEYEGTGLSQMRLFELLQKLMDDEIIIPIEPWKRRDETTFKIKRLDKAKILRQIYSEIIKKEKKIRTRLEKVIYSYD